MQIVDSLLTEYDQEIANTRKVLERCPEDKYGWTPHEKSFTMDKLATHVANITKWGALVLEQDSFDYAPPGAPPYKEDPYKTRKELLEHFDEGAAKFRAALAKVKEEDLAKPWALLAGGKTVFSAPRMSVLRGMIFNHAIHHRAQLTVYLRLNDVPVPGIYGPSADETGQ
jgi:uncharacterized damage-inducible protein DinB